MAKSAKRFVVCVENEGYEASLERRKIYVVESDRSAEKRGLLRVIDESGDSYLFPLRSFLPVSLPQAIRRALLQAA